MANGIVLFIFGCLAVPLVCGQVWIDTTPPPLYGQTTPPPPVYSQPTPSPVYESNVVDEVPYELPYELPYDMVPNDNGYGTQRPQCHMEEKISYEDICEPYEEETCYTQIKEHCRRVPFKNCTSGIDNDVSRVCLNVTELLCSLEQKTEYKKVVENYQVQKCTTVKDRVCDTTYHIAVSTQDDYQCCDVESQYCEDKMVVLDDVVCKSTFKFDCKKVKRGDGGYGKETVCTKEPLEKCYKTPRTIRKQVCTPRVQKHCEKLSKPNPRPVERQNCHFEPKKKCELSEKSRPRKAKMYSYHKHCKPIAREICELAEKKSLFPNCNTEYRNHCDYEPVEKCHKDEKQYCYKQEKITMEEVCDKKLSLEYLQ